MKLFQQLHIKFLIIPLVAVGSLLAVTFCTIFGITYTSTINELNDSIEVEANTINVLHEPNSGGRNLIIYITVADDGSSSYKSYYAYEDKSKIDAIAASLTKEQAFLKIDSSRYLYKLGDKKSTEEGMVYGYAIINCTEQFKTITTLGFTLLVVYLVSLVIIAGLSFILATSATKPVKEAFEKERDLVANASHELKTPLTIARTNIELLSSNQNSTIKENQKWIDSAKYQIDRMNSLILQMLELSKMERDDYKVEKTNQNISSLIEGILLSFEAACYENNIRFVSDLQSNIYYECNKIETEKLITILIDNAIKYTPKNGEISVSLAKTLKMISIKVTNTGEGIPQEKINRIFDRFYKLDASHKESGNSFGLGLSIAKLIANSMNGDVICYSELGKFTTFEIQLPLH